MRLFFVEPRSIIENTAHLSPDESRHIASVLRLQPGEAIELFDGTGVIYQGELLKVSRECVTVRLLAGHRAAEEPASPLCLMQSMLKGKKMDFLVQKATELGVHTFQPLLTRYSENRGHPERQRERWQRIALEACKQCKRPVPMRIEPVAGYAPFGSVHKATKFLVWEAEQQQCFRPQLLAGQHPVYLLIGPEGGFHADEVNSARENGFMPVSLGRRTLRAETAALAAVSIVQYLLGMLDI